MRFILNFIFYGILFYLIYLAFPEAFFTLVSWVDQLTNVLKDLFAQLFAKFQEWRGEHLPHSAPQQVLLFFLGSAVRTR